MKIAVLSDIHDNIWNLRKVLADLKEKGAEAIIFCGDFCAPGTFKTLAEAKIPIHAVLGNVDGAAFQLVALALTQFRNVTFYGYQGEHFGETDFEGKRIAFCHEPKFAEGLACLGEYDAVFYGHTHKASQQQVKKTLLLNPGEVMGKSGKCTYAIYDTEINKAKVIEVS
jgi:putative phosphoesterase